jgi:putative FmdB family regulatory protein
MTEYPFICKNCGYEADVYYSISSVPDKPIKCPKCNKKKFVQDIAKKLKGTSTIIPSHMKASNEDYHNFRRGYGKKGKKEVF